MKTRFEGRKGAARGSERAGKQPGFAKAVASRPRLRARSAGAWRDMFLPAPVPTGRSLTGLREAAAECRACPLWRRGTQTVFGEGPAKARVLLVGEQPGDAEDVAGKPFVGPAGRLLDRALEAAGVDRAAVYVTNAVKHFKWEARGKRRMHETPTEREVAACRPWLEAELESLKPARVVCLGATAALSVFGERVKVLRNRGRVIQIGSRKALITVHPSMLLRLPASVDREEEFARFVEDLRKILAGADLWG